MQNKNNFYTSPQIHIEYKTKYSIFYYAMKNKYAISFGTLIILFFNILVFVFGVIVNSSPAYAAGSISGTIFQDFNSNGVMNTSIASTTAADIGISGVSVIAKCVTSRGADTILGTADDTITTYSAVASATTTGTYVIDTTVPVAPIVPSGSETSAGQKVCRVELDNSTLPLGYLTSFQGSDSKTFVTFANDGDTGVSFGINYAADYSEDNPNMATNIFIQGDQLATVSPVTTLLSFPYNAGSTRQTGTDPFPDYDNPTTHTTTITSGQVGSIWGIAWAPKQNRLYAASFFKRHVGFGPGGPGAIYVINPTTNTITNTFTVPNATTDLHDSTNNYISDNGNIGWDAVGKSSLGGIDLSDDGTVIYATNLEDRKIYALNALTGSVVNSQIVPLNPPSCPATNDVRPFALKYYHGKLYSGLTCTAESTGNSSDLKAYIYEVDPSTLAFSVAPIFQASLNYPRLSISPTGSNLGVWKAWANVFSNLETSGIYLGQYIHSYPQPWFTDIAIDSFNNFILGFRDRAGDQVGAFEQSGPAGDTNYYSAIDGGDILKACSNGNATWTLENNSRCGGLGSGTQSNNSGPGNGEFFYGENLLTFHHEVSNGGVNFVPGFRDVALTVYDPIPLSDGPGQNSDGGVRLLNNTTGAFSQGYRLYNGNYSPNDYYFAKGNGMGDVEALSSPAPIEIGNRIWQDSNANGQQDPGEAPISGVLVELYKAGVLVGTSTTNSLGEYYFNPNNVSGGVLVGTGTVGGNSDYELRIPNVIGASKQVSLGTNVLVTANSGSDSTDSDFQLGSGATANDAVFPILYNDLNGVGFNNHTYDAGFYAPSVTYSLGNRVWLDDGAGGGVQNNGIIDGTEVGVAGVLIRLLDSSSAYTGYSTTTDSQGYYRLDGLSAGSYKVEVASSTFNGAGVLVGKLSSTGQNNVFTTLTGDNRDHGDDNLNPAVNGVTSLVFSLGSGVTDEATSTPVVSNASGNGLNGDNNDNLTIDFGFYTPTTSMPTTVISSGGGGFVLPIFNNPSVQSPPIISSGLVGFPTIQLRFISDIARAIIFPKTGYVNKAIQKLYNAKTIFSDVDLNQEDLNLAVTELVLQSIIQPDINNKIYPEKKISGEEALFQLSKICAVEKDLNMNSENEPKLKELLNLIQINCKIKSSSEDLYQTFNQKNLFPSDITKNDLESSVARGQWFVMLFRTFEILSSGQEKYLNSYQIDIPAAGIKKLQTFRSLLSRTDVWLPKLQSGAAFYEDHSLKKTVIFAHSSYYFNIEPNSFGSIFSKLIKKIRIGDKIVINKGDAKVVYKITGYKKVNEVDISVLEKDKDSELFLFTCDNNLAFRHLWMAVKE